MKFIGSHLQSRFILLVLIAFDRKLKKHLKECLLFSGLFILGVSTSVIHAQHGLSMVYAPSKVLKHKKDLFFEIPKSSDEFRLAYTFQTDGKSRWSRYWNKPRIAINALYINYGEAEVLGNAFAILPELHFTLKKWKDFRLNLQFGTGIAYLNKPFDAVTNPDNNAIGSNLNNVTSLKFGLAYQWNDRWITTLSTGLVHVSNGLSSSPNSGINIYGLSVGGVYSFGMNREKEDLSPLFLSDSTATTFKRWIVDLQYQYGFTEYIVPGGPKYAVHAYSLGIGYRYTEFMTLVLGGEYEFSQERFIFFKRNFHTEEESLDRARSTIIYLENELRFGRVFNRFRLGFYLPYPIKNSRMPYTKFVTGLYLPKIKGTVRPYVGVVLKTHAAVAEYLGILIGASL